MITMHRFITITWFARKDNKFFDLLATIRPSKSRYIEISSLQKHQSAHGSCTCKLFNISNSFSTMISILKSFLFEPANIFCI